MMLSSRFGNLLAFVFTIVVNGLANGLPINGKTTGEVSAIYSSLFTPAGFTFSIWGLIYLLLAAFIVYQLLPAQSNKPLIDEISPYFKLKCLANGAWIFAWHYEALWLSLVLMAVILFSLIKIYGCLRRSKSDDKLTRFVCLYLPFSIYLGWICVASIANISVIQTAMGWDNAGLNEISWTFLKLAFAGALGAFMVLRKSDWAFTLVIAWAAYGISVKQASVASVHTTALAVMLLSLSLAAYSLFKQLRRSAPRVS